MRVGGLQSREGFLLGVPFVLGCAGGAVVDLCWQGAGPAWLVGYESVPSLAVSAFWSGKLACLIKPTARTFSL